MVIDFCIWVCLKIVYPKIHWIIIFPLKVAMLFGIPDFQTPLFLAFHGTWDTSVG